MFKSLDEIINENYQQLNEIDLHILKYIKNNILFSTQVSISKLAVECNTSTASILRMTRKLNFVGFSDFKYFLKRECEAVQKVSNQSSLDTLNHDLQETIKTFEHSDIKDDIFELIRNAETIYAYGTGYGQRLMLSEFARCLLNVNKHLVLINASTEFKIARKNFKQKDLIFIASLSGCIDKYEETMTYLSVRDIPVISITNMHTNVLSSYTKYNLYFHMTSIDENISQSSFLTLLLLLHLVYEGYKDYIELQMN